MKHAAFLVGIAGWVLVGVGCGGSQSGSTLHCREEEGQEKCVTSGGPGQGIVTAAGAGALWATAGGCKIAGCKPPLACNQDTELCQPMRCGEDLRRCPDGYACDMETRSCR